MFFIKTLSDFRDLDISCKHLVTRSWPTNGPVLSLWVNELPEHGALSTLSQAALGRGPTAPSCPKLCSSQTSSLRKQSLPCSGVYVLFFLCACVCVCEQVNKRVKGEISCWEVCHHELREHYIVIISLVFQLPVTFSDLLIFSMIFSHIHHITPNTLSTHYPVFTCTIFFSCVIQYSK